MFNWRLELIKPSPLDLFLVVWYNQMCLNEPMFLPEWTWTVISRCNVCPAGCLCSGVIPVSLLARGFPSSRSTQGYYCGGGSELCCYTRLKFPTAIRANISERSQPDKSITSSLVYLTKLHLKVNMKSQPSWRGCEHSGSVFIHLLRISDVIMDWVISRVWNVTDYRSIDSHWFLWSAFLSWLRLFSFPHNNWDSRLDHLCLVTRRGLFMCSPVIYTM